MFPVTSVKIWLMRRFVSRSMPLETLTRTVSGVRYGAIFFPVSRTAKDGVAEITSSAPFRQSKSPLIFRLSGSRTPFSLEFSRVFAISAAFAGSWDHKVTSCPLSQSTMLRAVPQPPLPTTTAFMLSS